MTSNIKPSIDQQTNIELEQISKQAKLGIKQYFLSDDQRATNFSRSIENLTFDFSKTHISSSLVATYTNYANEIKFIDKRHALFTGKKINVTEDRSVLHTLLRDANNQGDALENDGLMEQAQSARKQLSTKYQSIMQVLDQRKHAVTDIIHVGIGGSSLGTQLLFESLKELNSAINIHFIGNIDAHQLVDVLSKCHVDTTLVIGVSKTFSTAETLKNLKTISNWFERNGKSDVFDSYYAVTADVSNAQAFGIPTNNIVAFPTWVGGRYSVWSAVSLSAIIVLGIEKFESFLAGAAIVDEHFYKTDLQNNVCFIASALDHFYCNYMGSSAKAIFAYDYRLRSLVDYLQQLETESNGKDRQINGESVDQKTSPVVWGGVGTDVQHSVFQMLHQGTSLIPAEFILVKKPDHDLNDHHSELLANGLAQTAALLAGQDEEIVRSINKDKQLSDTAIKAKIFSGDRPSTTIVFDRLDAKSLGMLLAFYEHRTFSSGVLANINSFDQMGVELGKRLANDLKPLLTGSETPQFKENTTEFDQSTLALIDLINE